MADMADMLKSFSSMMEGKQIPDNIKEMLNSLQNNSAQNGANTSNSTTANTTESNMNFYFVVELYYYFVCILAFAVVYFYKHLDSYNACNLEVRSMDN